MAKVKTQLCQSPKKPYFESVLVQNPFRSDICPRFSVSKFHLSLTISFENIAFHSYPSDPAQCRNSPRNGATMRRVDVPSFVFFLPPPFAGKFSFWHASSRAKGGQARRRLFPLFCTFRVAPHCSSEYVRRAETRNQVRG